MNSKIQKYFRACQKDDIPYIQTIKDREVIFQVEQTGQFAGFTGLHFAAFHNAVLVLDYLLINYPELQYIFTDRTINL